MGFSINIGVPVVYKQDKKQNLVKHQPAELLDLAQNVEGGEEFLSYLKGQNWRLFENANAGGLAISKVEAGVAGYITAKTWEKIFDTETNGMASRRHREGFIHIHDLSRLVAYCSGWDLRDILRYGLPSLSAFPGARKAEHTLALLHQTATAFFTWAQEWAGAVAVQDWDVLLAPFVRKDNLSRNELKQYIQSFLYAVNTPGRSGLQAPFSNITMKVIGSPKENVVAPKEYQHLTYADFQDEIDMINEVYAEVMTEEFKRGYLLSFPIPTYNIDKRFWEAKSVPAIMDMAAFTGAPYFANFINSPLDPDDVYSLCCRLRLDMTEIHRRGGFFASWAKTGSVGVVTISWPHVAVEANGDVDKFKEILVELMDLARRILMVRRHVVEHLFDKGFMPFSAFYLKSVKDAHGSWLANHFATIGMIGAHQAAKIMGWDDGLFNPEAVEWAANMLKFMVDKSVEFQKEDGVFYNIEATPAEGASYRLARLFVKKYPQYSHIIPGMPDAPYFDNSVHITEAQARGDLAAYIDIQSKLQPIFTGGTVVHIYTHDATMTGESLALLLKRIFTKTEIPYVSYTPTLVVCYCPDGRRKLITWNDIEWVEGEPKCVCD